MKSSSDSDDPIDAEALLTSRDAGSLLQVNPSSVNKWVDDGRIQAFRTPGGHRRIRARDLVTFLEQHGIPVPARLQGASQRSLLLVDDDPAFLRATARILRPYASRLRVLTCDNGIDALVTVGAERPNLVLIDVVMPEVDGLEVCRRLRAKPNTKSIDVVLMSGVVTPELARAATEAGAVGCVQKPLPARTILELARVPIGP